MDLALLGLIAVHLVVWQMLLVCAGSPIGGGRHEDNSLPLDGSSSSSSEVTRLLSNNVSYEISTNSKSKVTHVFNNYLRVEQDAGSATATSGSGTSSQISSIYEIFFINHGNGVRKRSAHQKVPTGKAKRVRAGAKSTLDRNERSANLSHITGSARKIQLYIKNRFLQLMPDGTVNGTTDDLSDYSEYRWLSESFSKKKLEKT
jgi:hypothetical protein